jgi:hypothetical protein
MTKNRANGSTEIHPLPSTNSNDHMRQLRITRRQHKRQLLVTFMTHANPKTKPAPVANILKTIFSLFA